MCRAIVRLIHNVSEDVSLFDRSDGNSVYRSVDVTATAESSLGKNINIDKTKR